MIIIMKQISLFFAKHRLNVFLAFLALCFSVIIGYLSGNSWIFIFTILVTLFPIVIWIIDAKKADAEYDKLDRKYKEMEEANAAVMKKNELIAAQNREIEQLNKSLQHEIGVVTNSKGEIVDSNLRWK